MQDGATMTAKPDRADGFVRSFARELVAGLRHHGLLFAGGATIFAMGYTLSLISGHLLAASPLGFAVTYVGIAGLIVGLAILLYKFFAMAFVERPERPLTELLRWVRHDILNPPRLANGANGMIFVFLLMGGFTMAKNNVSRFGGFRWDAELAEFDRLLHFGSYPHEWLQPLLGHPWVTMLIDRNYVLWFPVLFASCFIAAFQNQRSFMRHRFLLSLLFAWGLGGMAMAITLSSAGPVYFAQVTGLADPYAAHFAYLRGVDGLLELKALGIQDKLWATYAAEPSVSLISAMPSMHSTITVLVCIACWPQGGWLRIVVSAFTVLILIGSVHLGWHYAADAYAGIAIALLAWFLSGRISAWYLGRQA